VYGALALGLESPGAFAFLFVAGRRCLAGAMPSSKRWLRSTLDMRLPLLGGSLEASGAFSMGSSSELSSLSFTICLENKFFYLYTSCIPPASLESTEAVFSLSALGTLASKRERVV